MALFPTITGWWCYFGPEKLDRPAVNDMAAALTSGKGKIGQDADMALLLKEADTGKPIWAAARLSEEDRKKPVLAPFASISVSAESRGGDMAIQAKARGTDVAKVKAAVGEANGDVAAGVKMLEAGIAGDARHPPGLARIMGPVLDSFKSVKFGADGLLASGSATIPDARQTVLLVPMAMDLMARIESKATAATQPATAQPVGADNGG